MVPSRGSILNLVVYLLGTDEPVKFNSRINNRDGFLNEYNIPSVVISSVRIRVLDVPQAAKAGLDVKLTCDYDLQGQRLYQVKWYKGSHEFYRYSPNDENKIKLFLVENLDVDPRRSDSTTVVLKNLHVDMTGTYTCEVSTEGTFETVQASAKMDVILIPKGGPHIQGYHEIVEVGDTLILNCTSLKSKPAAQLTFYINNKKIKGRRSHISLRKYVITNEKDRPKTETSILSMELKVKRHHVVNSRIHVR
ncbi:unnamed protein product [Lepeophtheirus salmonis]|uniref:(salmon louse) hypothetical protein n=1 Tax=Lepeophtheirus salmonis TaxID=72036 RepID=A0A7R8CKM0_LEPSM|nr:unnamed protein product [Lepeophtheirus salmonis]CAF2849627.1 unnamed protein product [Lepeophtheirus salmonis]